MGRPVEHTVRTFRISEDSVNLSYWSNLDLTSRKVSIFPDLLQVFDDDKSGKLDFVEYMMAVQSTQLKSPEEKLNWIFKMYDKVGQIMKIFK